MPAEHKTFPQAGIEVSARKIDAETYATTGTGKIRTGTDVGIASSSSARAPVTGDTAAGQRTRRLVSASRAGQEAVHGQGEQTTCPGRNAAHICMEID